MPTINGFNQEKCVEQLQSEGEPVKKDLILNNGTGSILSKTSFGNVDTIESICAAQFLKKKEKEAQLVGVISNVSNKCVSLELVNSLSLSLGAPSSSVQNTVSGCAITNGGNLLISEYNSSEFNDRISLHNFSGNCIGAVENNSKETFYKLSNLRKPSSSPFVVSANNSFQLFGTRSLHATRTIETDSTCYGVTGYKDDIFFCFSNGISKHSTSRGNNNLLFKSEFTLFSFIYYRDKRLYFTRGDGSSSVSCCDGYGKHLWTYEDAGILREARGVVVDKSGHVFVAGI